MKKITNIKDIINFYKTAEIAFLVFFILTSVAAALVLALNWTILSYFAPCFFAYFYMAIIHIVYCSYSIIHANEKIFNFIKKYMKVLLNL